MVLTCRLLTHGSWSLIKFSSSSWRQKWDTCLREGLKILRPGSILLKVWHITAHAIISQSLTSVYIPSARNGVDRWIWLWPVLRSSSILRGRSSSGSIQVWRGKRSYILLIDVILSGIFQVKREWRPIRFISVFLYAFRDQGELLLYPDGKIKKRTTWFFQKILPYHEAAASPVLWRPCINHSSIGV